LVQINGSQSTESANVKVIENLADQYSNMMETLTKKSVMAIQDDYSYWKSSNYKKNFGKLMLIDQQDKNIHHIFFDDNADE
jgi:hypothetical protein